MTVLVLGETSQLACHLRDLLPTATFVGRKKLDFAEPAALPDAIRALRPAAIVNTAGYTAVDKAELEPELAWRINADAVAAIARTAAAMNVPMVQISTDYVFDGRKTGEYEEGDALNPLNLYGATKAAAELAVRTLCPGAWVLRVSWMFSEHGENFVKKVVRLAAAGNELRVVNDQHGRPTYAAHVARAIGRLIEGSQHLLPYGTHHVVGGPVLSWHAFACEILRRAHERGLIAERPDVHAISSSDYAAKARRPSNSALRPSIELDRSLHLSMDWRPGLDDALTALGEAG